MKSKLSIALILSIVLVALCPMLVFATINKIPPVYNGNYQYCLTVGYLTGADPFEVIIYSNAKLNVNDFSFGLGQWSCNTRNVGGSYSTCTAAIYDYYTGWPANWPTGTGYGVGSGGNSDANNMMGIIDGNYNIGDYTMQELTVNNPIDKSTNNTYQDINFTYTKVKYLEVVMSDKKIIDNPQTPLVENHIYTWFFDAPSTYTIEQANIPYSNSEYQIDFYYSSDDSNYVYWKSMSYTINPPSIKSITCNVINNETYNQPQNIIIRSVDYSPYTIYINDKPIKRVVVDGGTILMPVTNVKNGSINSDDFYVYRLGKNSIKAIQDDGTELLNLSVTYLRDYVDNMPPDTVGDGKLIDLSPPDREDFEEGVMGSIEYSLSYLIYLLTFPFAAIAKLFSILNNHFATFLTSTTGVSNFFIQMFGFLPSEVVTVIVIVITLSAFFFILKIFRG